MVDPVSREFDRRKSHFLKSLPAAHVHRIQRIQNKLLWRKYISKKTALESDPTLQNSGERILYHGTRDTKPEVIYEGDSGFDMHYSREGMWGRGNYFAVKSAYSVGYSHKTRDGYQQMLVARVLTGASYRSPPHKFQVPPEREGTGQWQGEVWQRYDSVNGETKGSTVYITYDNDHSYPEYLITFTTQFVSKIRSFELFSGDLEVATNPKLYVSKDTGKACTISLHPTENELVEHYYAAIIEKSDL